MTPKVGRKTFQIIISSYLEKLKKYCIVFSDLFQTKCLLKFDGWQAIGLPE